MALLLLSGSMVSKNSACSGVTCRCMSMRTLLFCGISYRYVKGL